MLYVGVDGCRGGWLAIALKSDDNFEVQHREEIAEIWGLYRNFTDNIDNILLCFGGKLKKGY